MYREWQIGRNSLRAQGGADPVYTHNTPISDFLLVARTVVSLGRTGDVTKADVRAHIIESEGAQGRRLAGSSQAYKFAMTFEFLEDRGMIARRPVRRGRYIQYAIRKQPGAIEKWLRGLETEASRGTS